MVDLKQYYNKRVPMRTFELDFLMGDRAKNQELVKQEIFNEEMEILKIESEKYSKKFSNIAKIDFEEMFGFLQKETRNNSEMVKCEGSYRKKIYLIGKYKMLSYVNRKIINV